VPLMTTIKYNAMFRTHLFGPGWGQWIEISKLRWLVRFAKLYLETV